jgi:phosphoribosylcarboxyaminoimidazole (NCAIR) mutase
VKADVVIAGAGKAAALPGIIKSWLCGADRSDIPVLGVALKGHSTREDQAAISSIEELPGQPVELNAEGHAYFGAEGFKQALVAALEHEFLPKKVEYKPAEIGLFELSTH